MVAATAWSSRVVQHEISVPFGKYCRSSLLRCSLLPRCQGLSASAKRTGNPISHVRSACADISFPRSQARERRKLGGSTSKVLTSAFFIVTAPYPAHAGPFFLELISPYPVCLGRGTNIAKRVVRSIRVAIAERLRPMMRPPPFAFVVGDAGAVLVCRSACRWQLRPKSPSQPTLRGREIPCSSLGAITTRVSANARHARETHSRLHEPRHYRFVRRVQHR